LTIIDNGIGLKEGFTFSMGLKGIESRVNNLMGTFNLMNSKKGGACLKICMPLEKQK